jgi:putative DNA primase/helicase
MTLPPNQDELRHQGRTKVEDERAAFANSPDNDGFLLQCCNTGEAGDALLFIKLNLGLLCYDHSSGSWYYFNGQHWRRCKIDEPLAAFEVLISEYEKLSKKWSWRRRNAVKGGDTIEAQKSKQVENNLLKKISQLRNFRYRQSVLKLAVAGSESLGISGEEWDSHPYLLPCVNGVLEIISGTFRPGKWQDYIKTPCPTRWESHTEPRLKFSQFILEIMGGNQEDAAYLQRLLGSAITGRVEENILAIFWGITGRNGKTVLLEVLKHVLGDLAGPIQAEMLLAQKFPPNPNAPSPAIISLRAKRLTWASETEENRRLNSGKVKWLSGNDTLVGRGPYDRYEVSFKPSHSLFLVTNFKPKINPQDEALWERIHLVNFPIKFVDNPKGDRQRKRDINLEEDLKKEASGILAYLLEGYYQYKEIGLAPPPSILSSTKKYRQEEDSIAQFIEQNCIVDETQKQQADPLHAAYLAFCEEEGFKPRGKKTFFLILHQQFSKDRENKCIYYYGLSLKG